MSSRTKRCLRIADPIIDRTEALVRQQMTTFWRLVRQPNGHRLLRVLRLLHRFERLGMALIGILMWYQSRAGLTCKPIHIMFGSSHMPNEWVSPEFTLSARRPTIWRLRRSTHRSEGRTCTQSPPNGCHLRVNYLSCVENTEQDLWAMSERENWR